GSGFYFTDNPESASGYSGQKDGSVVMPIYLSLQNPLSIDFALGEMQGADLKLTKALTRNVIMQAPNIRNVEESPLLNFG
ncbi:hypothetical protein H6A64_15335, partial [Lacrimispora saccharolytica]|nr:hypothetical protein [Lacrimispora saccharolytica]